MVLGRPVGCPVEGATGPGCPVAAVSSAAGWEGKPGGLEGESRSSGWEREGFQFLGGPGWLMRPQMP